MVLEAQLDRQHSRERRIVADYLQAHRHGEKMLASLGSLSHFVQELSSIGVHVRDVVHEGNGDLWAAALEHPSAHVGWVLVEELSEGGDVLAAACPREAGIPRRLLAGGRRRGRRALRSGPPE